MYISVESVCKQAIEKGELLQFLKGEDGYEFPDSHNGPGSVDYPTRSTAFNSLYMAERNNEYLNAFYQCINTLLQGSIEDIFIAIQYIRNQFRLESKNRAAFVINNTAFLDNIRDIIESRKPELERLNATNSRYQNAWGEIEEYNNSSTQRYGRSFL
jgi:hypothetical protein